MARAGRSLNRFQKQTKRATGTLALMGDRLKLIAGTAIAFGSVALFAKWIVSIEQFNQAMRSSQAIMGPLTRSIKQSMTTAALEVARVTKFSATEVAEAYFFLASAGLDAARSIAALPAVARFAQAGMFNMSLATQLLTDAMSALGLKVKNAEQNLRNMVKLSDILVTANTLADASVEQFAKALSSKAAAKMKVFNIEVEQGVAVLAAFADQGLKAELGGRAFAIVVRDLTRAAVESQKAFEKWNIRVFDDLGGLRDLADILEDIEKAFKGASTRGRTGIRKELGLPSRSAEFLDVLIGSSAAIREFTMALRLSATRTKRIAEIQLTDWAKGWEAFTGALASFGRNLQPVIDVLGKFLKFTFGPEPKPKVIGRRSPAAIADERGVKLFRARESLRIQRQRLDDANNKVLAKQFRQSDVADASRVLARATQTQEAYRIQLAKSKDTLRDFVREGVDPVWIREMEASVEVWTKDVQKIGLKVVKAEAALVLAQKARAEWQRQILRDKSRIGLPQIKVLAPDIDALKEAVTRAAERVYKVALGGRSAIDLTPKQIAELEVEQARQIVENKLAAKGFKEETERVADAWKDVQKNAKRFFVDTRTPLERYEATVGQLNTALAGGAFDPFGGEDTFSRAMAAARKTFEDATKPPKVEPPGLPDRGLRSLEQLGGTAGAEVVSRAETAQAKEFAELLKIRKILEQINRKQPAGMAP